MGTSAGAPSVILFNARVLTQEQANPVAEMVAVRNGRIAWVGSNSEIASLSAGSARLIDCGGKTLIPGFVDAHCHLLAYAASLIAIDCGPRSVGSIADLQELLRKAARGTPKGRWMRGRGYDELSVSERRFPTRWEIDEAVPDHPVKLNHRSGHACVLNTKALSIAGISAETPDPVSGVIDRDWDTGKPTGLLLEMGDYIDGRVPPLSGDEIARGVRQASLRLVSLGVTSIQDATPSNSPGRWEAFGRFRDDGTVAPRVTMMAGADHIDEFLERGMAFGYGDDRLNLGAVKIMLTATTGALYPDPIALGHLVAKARVSGFQAAVHAVEAEAVEAAALALLRTHTQDGAPGRDRIEHCSECPPEILERLTGSGIVVVTQPGFLYYSGARYLAEVPEETRPSLYRIASFVRAGLNPAAGSDAPVAEPNPLAGIYSAATRRARTGETITPAEAVAVHEALRMHTISGAYASFQEEAKGSIAAGKLADLVLLDGDPTGVEPERIPEIQPVLTMIDGRVVWEA